MREEDKHRLRAKARRKAEKLVKKLAAKRVVTPEPVYDVRDAIPDKRTIEAEITARNGVEYVAMIKSIPGTGRMHPREKARKEYESGMRRAKLMGDLPDNNLDYAEFVRKKMRLRFGTKR
jgi:hypothetical protein